MRTINTIAILLALITAEGQAQNTSSEQTRTIEINNDNGDLSISFSDGVITEFTINGDAISEDRFGDYQEILDGFTEDGKEKPEPPTPPNSHRSDNNQSERLYAMMIDYLMDEDVINSATKYDVELKRKYMKVNGKKVSNLIHHECLDFFDDIYGHRLNFESEVRLKRAGSNTSKSISIVD